MQAQRAAVPKKVHENLLSVVYLPPQSFCRVSLAMRVSGPLACDPSCAGALPVGISVCPLDATLQPELLRRSPLRCVCLAYINQFCSVADGTWTCALCGARNHSASLARASSATPAPELTQAVVEYADPFAQPRPAELPPELDNAAACAPLTLFVVDEHVGRAALRDLRAAAAATLALLPPTAAVGLVTFGRTVSVYVLDQTPTDAAPPAS